MQTKKEKICLPDNLPVCDCNDDHGYDVLADKGEQGDGAESKNTVNRVMELKHPSKNTVNRVMELKHPSKNSEQGDGAASKNSEQGDGAASKNTMNRVMELQAKIQ